MEFFTDSQTSRVVSKALDGVAERHKTISGNIANAETPGYKHMQVDFENTLKQAIEVEEQYKQGRSNKFLPPGSLKTSNAKHINPNPVPTNIDDSVASIEKGTMEYRYDKNGVDMEMEMSALAKNTLKYMALSRLESKQFGLVRDALKS